MKCDLLPTLQYYNRFNYPLTLNEIHQFYAGPVPISKKILNQTLKTALETGIIQNQENYYFLPGKKEIVAERKRKKKISQSKFRKASAITNVLRLLPWVQFVGITGSLALAASHQKDDIDLIIVTSANRLWLTRGIVVTLLLLTNQYRRPNKIKNRICTNIWLDLLALDWPLEKHSSYTAHELSHIKPVLNKNQTYEKFLKANSWVSHHLPNFSQKQIPDLPPADPGSDSPPNFLQRLETLAYALQTSYMKKKITHEVVSPRKAIFHPQPRH